MIDAQPTVLRHVAGASRVVVVRPGCVLLAVESPKAFLLLEKRQSFSRNDGGQNRPRRWPKLAGSPNSPHFQSKVGQNCPQIGWNLPHF